jgi:hypothetical protein
MKLKLCGPQLNAISTERGTTQRGPGDLSRFMGSFRKIRIELGNSKAKRDDGMTSDSIPIVTCNIKIYLKVH